MEPTPTVNTSVTAAVGPVLMKNHGCPMQGRSDKTSKYRGVSWDTQKETWKARVYHGGKEMCLGHFANEEEAARARDAEARKIQGASCKLNFPDVASPQSQLPVSKYRGVSWQSTGPHSGMWRVRIYYEGHDYTLGYFRDEVEAAKAYDRQAWGMKKEVCKVNFPEDVHQLTEAERNGTLMIADLQALKQAATTNPRPRTAHASDTSPATVPMVVSTSLQTLGAPTTGPNDTMTPQEPPYLGQAQLCAYAPEQLPNGQLPTHADYGPSAFTAAMFATTQAFTVSPRMARTQQMLTNLHAQRQLMQAGHAGQASKGKCKRKRPTMGTQVALGAEAEAGDIAGSSEAAIASQSSPITSFDVSDSDALPGIYGPNQMGVGGYSSSSMLQRSPVSLRLMPSTSASYSASPLLSFPLLYAQRSQDILQHSTIATSTYPELLQQSQFTLAAYDRDPNNYTHDEDLAAASLAAMAGFPHGTQPKSLGLATVADHIELLRRATSPITMQQLQPFASLDSALNDCDILAGGLDSSFRP